MPLAECPVCRYRSPVRRENLGAYAQCLRCTSRFVPAVPAPPAPSRLRAWAAAAGAAAVVLAAAGFALWAA